MRILVPLLFTFVCSTPSALPAEDHHWPFLQQHKSLFDDGLSPRDADVNFVINNRPVSHEKHDFSGLEEQLQSALELARRPAITPTPVLVASRPLRDLQKAKRLLTVAANPNLKISMTSDGVQIWYTPPPPFKASPRDELEILECLAVLKYKQKEYDESARLLNELINLQKAELGATDLNVADMFIHLALVYRSCGKFEESKTAYLSALSIRKKNLPPTDPQIAATYSNLADLYYDFQDDQTAKSFRAKAEKIMDDNCIGIDPRPTPTTIFPSPCNSWTKF